MRRPTGQCATNCNVFYFDFRAIFREWDSNSPPCIKCAIACLFYFLTMYQQRSIPTYNGFYWFLSQLLKRKVVSWVKFTWYELKQIQTSVNQSAQVTVLLIARSVNKTSIIYYLPDFKSSISIPNNTCLIVMCRCEATFRVFQQSIHFTHFIAALMSGLSNISNLVQPLLASTSFIHT